MSAPLLTPHEHQPVYRVVRKHWSDPLDVSHSQTRGDNRWNTAAFPALYCCCSPRVASAVVLDVFRLAGIELADLKPEARPELIEVSWAGDVVDVASPEGVLAAGFPIEYPERVSREQTRRAAFDWHRQRLQGVLCRSASLCHLGFTSWEGKHQPWGELAIFTQNSPAHPRLVKRRDDLGWLSMP